MKKYLSPKAHLEIIQPEETLLLSFSTNGTAGILDLGEFINSLTGSNASTTSDDGMGLG